MDPRRGNVVLDCSPLHNIAINAGCSCNIHLPIAIGGGSITPLYTNSVGSCRTLLVINAVGSFETSTVTNAVGSCHDSSYHNPPGRGFPLHNIVRKIRGLCSSPSRQMLLEDSSFFKRLSLLWNEKLEEV